MSLPASLAHHCGQANIDLRPKPRSADGALIGGLWEARMKRLSKQAFDPFVQDGVSAIMFLAPRGEASMAQAIDFAAAWASHRGPAFGYVDAFDDVALSRFFEIRVLPTTLVLRDGEEVVRLEGRCPAASIACAIAAAAAGAGLIRRGLGRARARVHSARG
jgi:hypothetical protein